MDDESYCLTLDIGTHSTRVALLSSALKIVWSKQYAYTVTHISPDHVEQDATEIVDACIAGIRESQSQLFKPSYAAISTQRSSVVAWDTQTGQPCGPLLSWMDTRGKDIVSDVAKYAQSIESISGLKLSPHYGASKLVWLKNNYLQRADSTIHIGPLASYICVRLTQLKNFVCDESNAGRTQLFDIKQRSWSDQLVDFFGLQDVVLPKISPTFCDFGPLALANSVRLLGLVGDQNAAFYYTYRLKTFNEQTSAVVNFGTGAFVITSNESNRSVPGLLNSLMWSDDKSATYALEATINGAGSALEWFVDELEKDIRNINAPSGSVRDDFFENLDHWITAYNATLDQAQFYPLFINSIGGLAAPFWRTDIKARFIGGTSKALVEHKAVAIVESIGFLVRKNVELMQKIKTIESLYISGGLTKSLGFCQLISNILGLTVVVSSQKEASLIGAAAMVFDKLQLSKCKNKEQKIQILQPNSHTQLNMRYHQFIAEIEAKG